MTSNFFSNKNCFDTIQDPIKTDLGLYWYLTPKEYELCCWDNQIFTDGEIERIKVIGNRLSLTRALTLGKNEEESLHHRRSFISWIHPNEHTSWIYQKLTDFIQQKNKSFFNFDLSKLETLQFTYYSSKEDGYYRSHVDSVDWNLPHNRKLSIVVQLSDPSEYEGGELRLHNSHKPVPVHKEKGLVVMFPSYTLHEVTPVTKGERYSLVAWVHGPAFK
jgi:PKHD-type hydroxylase